MFFAQLKEQQFPLLRTSYCSSVVLHLLFLNWIYQTCVALLRHLWLVANRVKVLNDFRMWTVWSQHVKSLTTFSKNIIASAKETKTSKCSCDWTLTPTKRRRIILVFSRDHLRPSVYICQTTKLSFAFIHKLVVGNLQIELPSFVANHSCSWANS